MKAVFVGYGALWLAATIAFALHPRKAQGAMLIAAIGSFWYLPRDCVQRCSNCLVVSDAKALAFIPRFSIELVTAKSNEALSNGSSGR